MESMKQSPYKSRGDQPQRRWVCTSKEVTWGAANAFAQYALCFPRADGLCSVCSMLRYPVCDEKKKKKGIPMLPVLGKGKYDLTLP